MSISKYIKRRESRAREAGFSNALRSEIEDLSPAPGLYHFAGVCLAAALLIMLLIVPAHRAQATVTACQIQNYYTIGNADIYQNINKQDEFQAEIHTALINYWDGEDFKPKDFAIYRYCRKCKAFISDQIFWGN